MFNGLKSRKVKGKIKNIQIIFSGVSLVVLACLKFPHSLKH